MSSPPVTPGIPDSATLQSMTRQDLNVLAAGLGLDPDDYETNQDVIDALELERPA